MLRHLGLIDLIRIKDVVRQGMLAGISAGY